MVQTSHSHIITSTQQIWGIVFSGSFKNPKKILNKRYEYLRKILGTIRVQLIFTFYDVLCEIYFFNL